ncbi:MAG: hypothetical protein H0X61_05920 [Acidimicrobiia bacterium]|nr:hypothetical protein [Acidimicrobiia bacterium]
MTASVGPFDAPAVVWKARISRRHRSMVRARRQSSGISASAACWKNTISRRVAWARSPAA